MTLSIQNKAAFLRMACDLSPENLSCDGELSVAKTRARAREITRNWKALEATVGQRVSVEHAYQFSDEVTQHEEAERAAAIAAMPSHSLVMAKNRGVWTREGGRGSSYYIWGPQHSGRDDYELFSEIAYQMGDKEKIGLYATLADAVTAGEQYLATITYELIASKRPMWRPEVIKDFLQRLPSDYSPVIPAMPKVAAFNLRFGSGSDTKTFENVAAEDVGAILVKMLIERGQHCAITSA